MTGKRKAAAALCATAFAVCNAASAGFVHEMPASTNEKPWNPPREEMERCFVSPQGRVQTGCYWYWMAGNVSAEGVVKDLEAMKRAGIDRAYIGDIADGGNRPGPVKTFSPEWEKALAAAFETASRIGVELGIFNSPGWSQSGGPWISPERAMRRFVVSPVVVQGPASGVKLPEPRFERAPAGDYRDVMAIAYPLPAGFEDSVVVKDGNDRLLQRKGRHLSVELSASRPFVAQSAELAFCDGKINGFARVEAMVGGKWKVVCEMPFSRTNGSTNVGFEPHAPVLLAFSPVEAQRFRVTVVPYGGGWQSRFSSFAIRGAPLLARAPEKSLAKMFETPLPMWNEYQWPNDVPEAQGSALDISKAVVLRGKTAADGTLDWDVPAGKWVVYRIGSAPTGVKNCPANPEATGYEVDKMNAEHVAFHFDSYLGKILERTPPEHRKAIRHAVLDSYEQGGQNFTDGFAEKFKASFGYDPVPYLPALAGVAAGSRDASNRFLWDLRRFVADEVAYSYVAGLRRASNAHGMGTWLECYGHWGFPGEFLQYGGQSDGIAGEYWSESDLGNIENRAASSCGHTYGKRLVWCESNTCAGRPYGRAPADLKKRTDRFFAEGINASLLHLYIHQPDERKPGFTASFGNEFNRHNTWFGQMDVFTDYLKRCNYMLQQGLYVADIAYFIGEDAPKMTGAADPAPPRGRQFDYINAEVLRETAAVDAAGRIVLPHGTSYEVLVLPKLETMRPELLERIEKLVHDGAFVMGPRPKRSPSLSGQPASDAKVAEIAARLWGGVDGKNVKYAKRGKGTIAWGLSLDEALAMRNSPCDFKAPANAPLAYCHRTMPGKDVYFVANQSNGKVSCEAVMRAGGRIPELWNPATGEIREAPVWRAEGGAVAVSLELAPLESVFVVMASPLGGRTASAPARKAAPQSLALDGEWSLRFESDPLHRGPAGAVKVPSLPGDLSKNANPAVRHYSGKVVYTKVFSARKPAPGERIVLSLGKVCETARVKINGRPAGGAWTAPFELPVGEFLADGDNVLEVEVCTSWVNRLVGDASLPPGERPTWMSVGGYGPKTPLKPSGLLGPVAISYR